MTSRSEEEEEDWFAARRLRDEGIDLVGTNNHDWLKSAVSIVSQHAPPTGEFMAEEFRKYPGIGEPGHRNAWGALTNQLIRLGIIERTGNYAQSVARTNHAHEYKKYRRTPGSFSGRGDIPLKKIPWTSP